MNNLDNSFVRSWGSFLIKAITTLSFSAPIYCIDLAQAANFNFTYGLETTEEQKIAFELAGKIWGTYLADPVNINIHVKMEKKENLPERVIGGAIPFFETNYNYSNFVDLLDLDSKHQDDIATINSLDRGSSWQTMTKFGLQQSNTINMTRANAKAIGAIAPDSAELDGLIVMNDLKNSSISWHYGYSRKMSNNTLDYTSVAIHEIGHILGFVSGLDLVSQDNPQEIINSANPLDLFRFHSKNRRELQNGHNIFSLNRGYNAIAEFAQGSEFDGYQASHWSNPLNVGIMDPLLQIKSKNKISTIDLIIMDAIGWDLKVPINASTSFDDDDEYENDYDNEYDNDALEDLNDKVINLEKTASKEIKNIIQQKNNKDLTKELTDTFLQWGWNKGGSKGTLGQETILSLNKLFPNGLFSSALWETLDESHINIDNANQVPEPNITGGIISILAIFFARKKSAFK
jgi:hypothetical protein